MKNLLLLMFILLSMVSFAQNSFKGKWFTNKVSDDFDAISVGLKVGDTTMFSVVDNQLALACKNVYHGDTLYLYVIDSDQGRAFMGPKFYPPKPKSLFAKCFIVKGQLNIIYTQKMFSQNIKTLELNTILYRH